MLLIYSKISQCPKCIKRLSQNDPNLILKHWTGFTFRGSGSDATGKLTPKTYNSRHLPSIYSTQGVFLIYFIGKIRVISSIITQYPNRIKRLCQNDLNLIMDRFYFQGLRIWFSWKPDTQRRPKTYNSRHLRYIERRVFFEIFYRKSSSYKQELSHYPKRIKRLSQNDLNLILKQWTGFTFSDSGSDVTGNLTLNLHSNIITPVTFDIWDAGCFLRYML